MKKLQDIIIGAGVLKIKGPTEIPVSELCLDSRMAGKKSLFAAITGTQVDGHRFIDNAIENGATSIICT